jgi:hypothetical protein
MAVITRAANVLRNERRRCDEDLLGFKAGSSGPALALIHVEFVIVYLWRSRPIRVGCAEKITKRPNLHKSNRSYGAIQAN